MEDVINIGVTVVEVRSLATWNVPVVWKKELYTAVRVSAKRDKTKAIPTTKDFVKWNETFHYAVRPNDSIEFEVRGHRFFGHEVFGKLRVPAGIVFDEGSFEGWFPIIKNGRNRGEIFIRVHYNPSPDSLTFP